MAVVVTPLLLLLSPAIASCQNLDQALEPPPSQVFLLSVTQRQDISLIKPTGRSEPPWLSGEVGYQLDISEAIQAR